MSISYLRQRECGVHRSTLGDLVVNVSLGFDGSFRFVEIEFKTRFGNVVRVSRTEGYERRERMRAEVGHRAIGWIERHLHWLARCVSETDQVAQAEDNKDIGRHLTKGGAQKTRPKCN